MYVGRLLTGFLAVSFLHTGDGIRHTSEIPLTLVEEWSANIGRAIQEFFTNLTLIDRIQQNFQKMNATIKRRDGDEMILEFATKVTDMLNQKHEAVQRLVDVAEKSNAAHEFNESLTLDYPRAKHLNPDFILTPNERLDFLPVNTSLSTVHVPTNIYDQSAEVLNGVAWSNALDEVFRINFETDPTIGWQYFSTAIGFFRIFPGLAWSIPPGTNGVDFFDSRIRPWYIQAATSPKDVVVLLDSSGSMTGQRLVIARMTVTAVMDTLSDDDFFNVITYGETANYIDDCFNGSIIQANGNNKQRIKKRLQTIQTKGVAHLEYGLIEAFTLLQKVDLMREGAMCNKAIIIISDEIIGTYKEIFQQFDHPKNEVRVFVYLIGRDVVNVSPSRYVACSNRGYFSSIATSADVTENVQRYVKTMARPMVLSRPRIAVWTSVYLSSTDANEQGLQLMSTLSQPVFDTRPEFNSSGNLLGVIGTDVPMTALTNLIPPYRLGVNGYSFAITNNGYILFHPDFRPLEGGTPKPNYSSVGLTEVEVSEDSSELEVRMVNRETGNLTMKTMTRSDQLRRLVVRTNNFYYAPIGGTQFTLGIVLPDGYGMTWLDGRISLEEADLSTLAGDNLIISSWNYCSNMVVDGRNSRLSVLLKTLEDKQARTMSGKRCDIDLIEHLLFDASVTRQVVGWWSDNIDSRNMSGSVRSIFVGTQAGLTRYWKQDNGTGLFPGQTTSSLMDLYYTSAVDGGKDIVTISSPLQPVTGNYSVTMSHPVVVVNGNLSSTVAVVGMQISNEHLMSIFNSAVSCNERMQSNCSLSCHDNQLDCYLLDNNGFVVLSNDQHQVGKFFGELEPTLMLQLQDDKDDPRLFYKGVIFYDYQDVCLLYSSNTSDSPPLISFRIFSWLLTSFFSIVSIFLQLLNELISLNWSFKSIVEFWMLADSVIGDSGSNTEPVMCDRPLNMFYAPNLSKTTAPSGSGSIGNCPEKCTRVYAFSHVPGTNLLFVVADSSCTCSKDPPISNERRDIQYNDSTMCSRLRQNSHRMRPDYCFSTHRMEKAGSCDGIRTSSPSSIVLMGIAIILMVIDISSW